MSTSDLVVLHEGKTKTIYQHPDANGWVLVRNKDDITAHDDPKFTKEFGTKAVCATMVACRVFELLEACGIPTSYIRQHSETEFVAMKSEMVALEIITRRLALGSFLKRNPHLTSNDPKKPVRFHNILFELFLKTTGRRWKGDTLPCDDPWIINPYADVWDLGLPKNLITDTDERGGLLSPFMSISSQDVLPNDMTVRQVEELARKTSLVIEKAWAILGIIWCDQKIEIDTMGRVSDVVDNDSWRILLDGVHLDKQAFREGEALGIVEKRYQQVARLSERLVLPRQAVVLWKASDSDPDIEFPDIPGVEVVRIAGSAHKSTTRMLEQTEGILRDFPQGGVFITQAGRSNGLGATAASHLPWPVITYSPSYEDFPEDIHSSIRCPSGAPAMTAWPESNAVEAAIHILGNINPAAYAHSQLQLEKMDSYTSGKN